MPIMQIHKIIDWKLVCEICAIGVSFVSFTQHLQEHGTYKHKTTYKTLLFSLAQNDKKVATCINFLTRILIGNSIFLH